MPHLSGKKIAKSHSTLIKEANLFLNHILKSNLVDKVVIGEIKVISSAPIRFKITPILAGFRLMIRGRNARQKIYLYTKNPKELMVLIENTINKIKLI